MNKTDALEKWMERMTSVLCYQPDIPQLMKTDLLRALDQYRTAEDKPGEDPRS